MNIYRLKISLAEPFLPITELHRLIEVDSSMSFGELAMHIGAVFGVSMADWQFFISRIKADNLTKLQAFECISAESDMAVHTLNLNEKDYFYLKAGEFLYRIRIEKLTQKANDTPLTLIKSVGELPISTPTLTGEERQKKLEFEALLLSSLAMIVSEEAEPVRFGELVEAGVADELVKRGLIRPCVSLSHRVRITPEGESELLRVLKLVGVL